MSQTDITPQGSACPVFTDPTPPTPGAPPVLATEVPDDALKLSATGKLATAAGLTPDESVAIFGDADISVIPTILPSGGGVLYAQGGALKWRGSSGKITTIARA